MADAASRFSGCKMTARDVERHWHSLMGELTVRSLAKLFCVVLLLLQAACASGDKIMATISTFPGEALTPVYAGNPACPDINGRYGYDRPFLLRQIPRVNNSNHIRIREEVIKGELIYNEWSPPVYYHDMDSFHEQAIVGVAQKGKALELTLMDSEGEPYKRVFVDLDNAAIGCRDGALVIRDSDFIWGELMGS